MKKIITNIILSLCIMTASLAVVPVATTHAAACSDKNFLVPKWYDDLCGSDGTTIASPANFKKQSTDATSTADNLGGWILVIAMNLVKTLLVVVGYVAIIGIIWGGFKFMTQGDNASGTAAARKTIQNAVIGLVISILSVAIINFVTGAIAG